MKAWGRIPHPECITKWESIAAARIGIEIGDKSCSSMHIPLTMLPLRPFAEAHIADSTTIGTKPTCCFG